MTVVVLAELLADGLQFRFVRPQIHCGHGFEVRCVEARREDRVLGRVLDGNG